MSRIRNSWQLAKVSWSVLRSDKTLAAFPVLSAIGAIVVIGAFGALTWLTGIDDTSTSSASSSALRPIAYVYLVLMYLALAIVTVYFQAALTFGANTRLQGDDATVGASMGQATAKLHRLVPWAVVVATVSIVIRALEERFGFVGQILAGLVGAAWNIVTFLAVPVIVLEDAGPGRALKRSGSLLRETWGENIVAQVGFGLFAILAFLPAAAVVGGAIALGSTVAIVATAIVAAVWLALVTVVVSALSGIYRTALYRFAVDRTPPPAFAGTALEHAFGARRHRGA